MTFRRKLTIIAIAACLTFTVERHVPLFVFGATVAIDHPSGPDLFQSSKKISDFFENYSETTPEKECIDIINYILAARPPGSTPYLIRLLRHDFFSVRKAAIHALFQLGDPAAVIPLTKCIDDYVVSVRLAAIEALVGIGDHRAVFPLFKAIGDNAPLVRIAAADAIEKLGNPVELTALDAFRFKPGAIEKTKDTERQFLLKVFVSFFHLWDKNFRAGAIWIPDRLEDPLFFDFLIKTTADPYPDIRTAAVWGLGKIKDPRATETLCHMLKDWHRSVRVAAVWSIGAIKTDASCVDLLAETMTDASSKVRETVIWSLWQVDGKRGILRIIDQAANDPSADVRKAAVGAIYHSGDPELAGALAVFLSDDDPKIRKDAVDVLSDLNRTAYVKRFIALLKDPDAEVRTAAAHALGKSGDAAAVLPLLNAMIAEKEIGQKPFNDALLKLNSPMGVLLSEYLSGKKDKLNGFLNRNEAEITSLMRQALEGSNTTAKKAAARYFEQTNAESAVQPLLKMAGGMNFGERTAAMSALFEIRPGSKTGYISNVVKVALLPFNLISYAFFFVLIAITCRRRGKTGARFSISDSLLIGAAAAGIIIPLQGAGLSIGFVSALFVYQLPAMILLAWKGLQAFFFREL